MNCVNKGRQFQSLYDRNDSGYPDLFLDLEPEVIETAAAGLPLRGSRMDATMRGSDGSGKSDLFLSFSPSVSYRQHPSEVHARAAYGVNNFTGGQDSALAYPPKLQKRQNLSVSINIKKVNMSENCNFAPQRSKGPYGSN